jgi:hypothetical protein
MPDKSNQKSVVKQGGIARDAADTEDVTRDTYGYSQAHSTRKNRSQRLADADRAAAAEGIPGVDVGGSESIVSREESDARDEQVRQTDVSGDRVASRRDAEKLRSKRS